MVIIVRVRRVAKETLNLLMVPKKRDSFLANRCPGWLPLIKYRMNKRIIITLMTLLTLGGIAFGDIQSPPGHHYNFSRKLSRGVGNLIYGWTEPLTVWKRSNRSDGYIAAFSDALIDGPKRILVRTGYGIYEVATFPLPTWKLTYRPPYYRKEKIDPWWGYTEFPPEIGFLTEVDYSRSQSW